MPPRVLANLPNETCLGKFILRQQLLFHHTIVASRDTQLANSRQSRNQIFLQNSAPPAHW
jgi:hypothetical protein